MYAAPSIGLEKYFTYKETTDHNSELQSASQSIPEEAQQHAAPDLVQSFNQALMLQLTLCWSKKNAKYKFIVAISCFLSLLSGLLYIIFVSG